MVETIPGTVFQSYFDEHWTMKYISNGVENLSGYPASDFVNNNVRTFTSIIHSGDIEYINDSVTKAIENNTAYSIEYRIINSSNEIRWVYERGFARPDDNESDYLVDGAIMDITGLKQAEEELRQSEERLAQAMAAGKMAAWDRDMQTGVTNSDAMYEKILGYEPGELDSSAKSWQKVVHPDDVLHVAKILDLFLQRKMPEFKVQYRAYTKNGELRWIEAIGNIAEKDEQGNPVRLMGIQQDITEPKTIRTSHRGKTG